MSLIKRLFFSLFKKEVRALKNVSKVTRHASSIETIKTMGSHDFSKLSREKFAEIKNDSQSLYK